VVRITPTPERNAESVIAYVHWLLLCFRNAVTSQAAASIGFIPSDDAIDELFPEIVAPHFALRG
jgi:hypothetical protein